MLQIHGLNCIQLRSRQEVPMFLPALRRRTLPTEFVKPSLKMFSNSWRKCLVKFNYFMKQSDGTFPSVGTAESHFSDDVSQPVVLLFNRQTENCVLKCVTFHCPMSVTNKQRRAAINGITASKFAEERRH